MSSNQKNVYIGETVCKNTYNHKSNIILEEIAFKNVQMHTTKCWWIFMFPSTILTWCMHA